MTSRRTCLLIPALAVVAAGLCTATAPVEAATVFNVTGGSIKTAGNWTNGLPSAGNDGTIAIDAVIGGNGFNFGATTVNQTAGAITDTGSWSFNMQGGATWNISGGSLTSRFILSNGSFNGSSTTLNASGGLVAVRSDSDGQFGVANSGKINISGSAVLDATGAGSGYVYAQAGGVINFLSGWTGSFTAPKYQNATTDMDWRTAMTTNSVFQFNGAAITEAIWDAHFAVTGDTLTMINATAVPTPAALPAGMALLGLATFRRPRKN